MSKIEGQGYGCHPLEIVKSIFAALEEWEEKRVLERMPERRKTARNSMGEEYDPELGHPDSYGP